MAGDLFAATRDASSYRRPDVRKRKVVHVADAGEWFTTGQPTRHVESEITLKSRCSGALLDNYVMYRSLADVPAHLRCQRPACRNQWPAVPTPTPDTEEN